ncbi:dimeric dihydrodiol dehydrogenase [Pseudozyma hubeiensis SY62]|uniref:D-xylose 1-dehydrogenase (NADP(+), D-xylono-1,5-lactone-forming) n=1 Tax=Pseudozyma hubeiensis (strain SY62) TaxID=1305764 RepID=R9P0D6_PSEHS|nr:dimeric dihydrodiol dehydrogenase [Pseudozyma hubeiensis SY62]GAC94658.1 dimeric dihydrodiol dehydrogenase [Pseudozyma hubeiensis SY62]
MSSPYECKWGILATGWIAEMFSKDLLVAPSSRSVSDVKHTITAVASSTSASRASEFLTKVGVPANTAAAYGSYEELVADPNVSIIYVATPHSHHYENCLLALNAGKHVCCEKPFTINAAQAEHLVEVARQKKLFLMEAVWIRFFPLVIELQRLIHEEKVLGEIRRVFSDFGNPFKPDPKHRLYNPELGGGALLDLGIYALTWQMLTLYQDPKNKATAPDVKGSIIKSDLTGVDEFTTILLNFPTARTQGVATTNMTIRSSPHVVLIQGTKADLTVDWPPYRPESFTIREKDDDGKWTGKEDTRKYEIPGHGMFWEADACARAIRDGKSEEERCSLKESILTMKIMDKVRYDNDFRYPDHLESTSSK